MKQTLCKPRKRHRCRLCNQWIEVGEPCRRWNGLQPGEGFFTSHAHPECYDLTDDWDECDWESAMPGDMDRPARPQTKLEAFTQEIIADRFADLGIEGMIPGSLRIT